MQWSFLFYYQPGRVCPPADQVKENVHLQFLRRVNATDVPLHNKGSLFIVNKNHSGFSVYNADFCFIFRGCNEMLAFLGRDSKL